MPRMNRRAFLLSSAVVGGVGLAGTSGYAFMSTGPEEVVTRIVRYRFPEVRIAEADLQAFARDFLIYDRTSRPKLQALRLLLPMMQSDRMSMMVPARVQALYLGFERRIVTKFTMSTDFFAQPAGAGRQLTYTTFADPYLLGCANTLARFDLENA